MGLNSLKDYRPNFSRDSDDDTHTMIYTSAVQIGKSTCKHSHFLNRISDFSTLLFCLQ